MYLKLPAMKMPTVAPSAMLPANSNPAAVPCAALWVLCDREAVYRLSKMHPDPPRAERGDRQQPHRGNPIQARRYAAAPAQTCNLQYHLRPSKFTVHPNRRLKITTRFLPCPGAAPRSRPRCSRVKERILAEPVQLYGQKNLILPTDTSKRQGNRPLSRARLLWNLKAKLPACYHLYPGPTAARR